MSGLEALINYFFRPKKLRLWRNWQTRMVEGHVPVKGVVVRIHSAALFLYPRAITYRSETDGKLKATVLPLVTVSGFEPLNAYRLQP